MPSLLYFAITIGVIIMSSTTGSIPTCPHFDGINRTTSYGQWIETTSSFNNPPRSKNVNCPHDICPENYVARGICENCTDNEKSLLQDGMKVLRARAPLYCEPLFPTPMPPSAGAPNPVITHSRTISKVITNAEKVKSITRFTTTRSTSNPITRDWRKSPTRTKSKHRKAKGTKTPSLSISISPEQCCTWGHMCRCPYNQVVMGRSTQSFIDPTCCATEMVSFGFGMISRPCCGAACISNCHYQCPFTTCDVKSEWALHCVDYSLQMQNDIVLDNTNVITTQLICPPGYLMKGMCMGPLCPKPNWIECVRFTRRDTEFPCYDPLVYTIIGTGSSRTSSLAVLQTKNLPSYAIDVGAPQFALSSTYQGRQSYFVYTAKGVMFITPTTGTMLNIPVTTTPSPADTNIVSIPLATAWSQASFALRIFNGIYFSSGNKVYVQPSFPNSDFNTASVKAGDGTSTVVEGAAFTSSGLCPIFCLEQTKSSDLLVCQPQGILLLSANKVTTIAGVTSSCNIRSDVPWPDESPTLRYSISTPLFSPYCVVEVAPNDYYFVENSTAYIKRVFGGVVTLVYVPPPHFSEVRHGGPIKCIYMSSVKTILLVYSTCVLKHNLQTNITRPVAGRCNNSGFADLTTPYSSRFVKLTSAFISDDGLDLVVVDRGANRVRVIKRVLDAHGYDITPTRSHTRSSEPSKPFTKSYTNYPDSFTPTLSLTPTWPHTMTTSHTPTPYRLSFSSSLSLSDSMSESLSPSYLETADFVSETGSERNREHSLTFPDAPTGTVSASLTNDPTLTADTGSRIHSPSLTLSNSYTRTRVSASPEMLTEEKSLSPVTGTPSNDATGSASLSVTDTVEVSTSDTLPITATQTSSRSITFSKRLTRSRRQLSNDPTQSSTFSISTTFTESKTLARSSTRTYGTRSRTFSDSLSESPSRSSTRTSSVDPTASTSLSVQRLTSTPTNTRSQSQTKSPSPTQTLSDTLNVTLTTSDTVTNTVDISTTITKSLRYSYIVIRSVKPIDGALISDEFVSPRPHFDVILSGDTFVPSKIAGIVNAIVLVSDDNDANGFTGIHRKTILASSYTELQPDLRILQIYLGSDDAYEPTTDQYISLSNISSFVGNGQEPHILEPRTVLLQKPLLPSAAARRAFMGAAAVSTSASMLNPSALMSMQSLAMLSSFSCLNPMVRAISQDASWTLSPLEKLFGSYGELPHFASAAMWNLTTAFLVVVIHSLIVLIVAKRRGETWNDTATNFLYPHIEFVTCQLLFQGTMQAMCKGALLYKSNSGAMFAVILGFLCLPLAFLCYTAIWLWRGLQGKWFEYRERDGMNKMLLWILPQGVWLPYAEQVRYGMLYADTIPKYRYFLVTYQIYVLMFTTASSVPPSSTELCHAQLLLTSAFMMFMGFTIAILRPFRSTLNNYTRGSVLIMQSLLVMICFVFDPSEELNTAIETLIILNYLVLTTDTVLVIYQIYWEDKVRKDYVAEDLELCSELRYRKKGDRVQSVAKDDPNNSNDSEMSMITAYIADSGAKHKNIKSFELDLFDVEGTTSAKDTSTSEIFELLGKLEPKSPALTLKAFNTAASRPTTTTFGVDILQDIAATMPSAPSKGGGGVKPKVIPRRPTRAGFVASSSPSPPPPRQQQGLQKLATFEL